MSQPHYRNISKVTKESRECISSQIIFSNLRYRSVSKHNLRGICDYKYPKGENEIAPAV